MADGSWLTVAGLFWLKEGPNRFGTDPRRRSCSRHRARFAGVFELKDGRTKVRVETGATVTSSGRTVIEMDLQNDTSGEPTLLALGDLTLFVIERDGKYGIRLKDKNSQRLKEFTGLKWYPVEARLPDHRDLSPLRPAQADPDRQRRGTDPETAMSRLRHLHRQR